MVPNYTLLPLFILFNNRLKLVDDKAILTFAQFSRLNYPLNSIPNGLFVNFVRLRESGKCLRSFLAYISTIAKARIVIHVCIERKFYTLLI